MRSNFDELMSANMVAMMRAGVEGAIWLVDDSDESRFYETVAHEQCRVLPAFGNALRVLQIVNDRGVRGVLGMTRGEAQEIGDLALFRPDIGDAASLLLVCRNSDRVLGEVGGAAWLAACGREVGSVLQRAIHVAKQLSVMFEGELCAETKLENIVDWDRFEVNWVWFEAGEFGHDPVADLIRLARSVQISGDSMVDLMGCDGLGAVRVLAAATQFYMPHGIQAYQQVSETYLLSLLRAAYDASDLEDDGVFWRLKGWQYKNRRYQLFRQWRRRESFGLITDQSYINNDLERVARSGFSFAALQVDLDNFKNVNERLGHGVGDEAIILTEKILMEVVNGRGESYRRGGDELVAIIVGVTHLEAVELAEELRRKVESEFVAWAQQRDLALPPTASVGVIYSSGNCLIKELGKILDATQRVAKLSGKNRVEYKEL